jgi:hypothetical protein
VALKVAGDGERVPEEGWKTLALGKGKISMESALSFLHDLWRQITEAVQVPWVALLAGILVSAFFWFVTRKTRRPYYTSRIVTLISELPDHIEGLRVSYFDHQLRGLKRIRIAFWNGGREAIRSDDIPRNDPIRFTLEGAPRIIFASVIAKARPSIEAEVELAFVNQLVLRLDDIDYGEGVVFEVLCDGEVNGVTGTGKVLGTRKVSSLNLDICEKKTHYTTIDGERISSFIAYTVLTALMGFFFWSLITFPGPMGAGKVALVLFSGTITLAGFAVLATATAMFFLTPKRLLKIPPTPQPEQ